MPARVLMFQGTGSDVGKSSLVAGLCRAAKKRGIRVAPFKPQNMSNNAAACANGGEIGRAQALQAKACGLPLDTDFNPVLLKPQSDMNAQVVVHGRVLGTTSASDYWNSERTQLMQAVLDSFYRLHEQYDLILVEGAGSASEINLRTRDIANMGFARAVESPVSLIGDIDRGGVIASLVGTKNVIDPDDASLITSFIVNRFRGDPTLFENGVSAIESITNWPCRGVVPWLSEIRRLPQEDAVVLESDSGPIQSNGADQLLIAVPMLSRIANFDDLDPLRAEPNVEVFFVSPGRPIPRHADAVVIPGTKSTLLDLAFMRAQGWDHDVIALARNGVRVLGICGGYQLLGKTISDPEGLEGQPGRVDGLGLLDVVTEMSKGKAVQQVEGICTRSEHAVQGYEIHIGVTTGEAISRPMLVTQGKHDGAISVSGLVEGTYMHGLFSSDKFRSWWLDSIRSGVSSNVNYDAQVEKDLDALAAALENSLHVDALLSDAQLPRTR